MSSDWRTDKAATDVYMREVRRIMGEVLLRDASDFEDQQENTDLRVLSVTGARVAVRIRKEADRAAYGHQFTIRLARPSGVTTELEKIADGWGDYFFYGFGDNVRLTKYIVVDLARFRKRLVLNYPAVKAQDCRNLDETTFRAFLIADFESAIIKRGER